MRYRLGENADQKRRKAEIGMAGPALAWGGIELDDLDALQQTSLEHIVERMSQVWSLPNTASCSTGSRSATIVMPTLFERASTEA